MKVIVSQRVVFFALILIAALFVITGCGDDDDDDDSGGAGGDDDDATECTIGGATYQDGAINPNNGCLVCDLSQSSSGWSLASDGVSCDDGEYCNGADTCQSGSCVHGGDPCESDEVCNEEDDSCDPGSDDDDNVDDDDTDDDDNVDDDDAATECVIGGVTYNDGQTAPDNVCLVCDASANSDGWSFNDDATCDDDVYCNGTDTCASGSCSQHSGDPCPDDGAYCNGTESCNEAQEQCDSTGDPCESDEVCDETADYCDPTGHQPAGYELTGTVTANGNALVTEFSGFDFYVDLFLWNATDGEIAYAGAIEDGVYGFPYVADGTYNIEIVFNIWSDDFDVYWTDSYAAQGIVINGNDFIEDIDLEFYEVCGDTIDNSVSPVNGVRVWIDDYDVSKVLEGTHVEAEYEMDSTDNVYCMFLPAGTLTFTWFPPPTSGYAQEWDADVVVSADQTQDHTFAAASTSIPVYFTDGTGNMGSFWSNYPDITYTFDNGTVVYDGTTDDDMVLDITLPDGSYDVTAEVKASGSAYYHYYDPDLTATVTNPSGVELALDMATISGVVTDPNGDTTGNVYVYLEHGTFPEDDPAATGWAMYAYDSPSINGEYEFTVPKGTYNIRFEPINAQGYAPEIVKDVNLNADMTLDHQFSDQVVTIDGTLTINGKIPWVFLGSLLTFGEVRFEDADGLVYYGEMDYDGTYEVKLATGKTYSIDVMMDSIVGLINMITFFVDDVESGYAPTVDATKDFDLTMYTLSGNVMEADGTTPAIGKLIYAESGDIDSFYKSGQGTAYTGSKMLVAGSYFTLPVIEGTYRINVFDENTAYCESVGGIDIDQDTQVDFVPTN